MSFFCHAGLCYWVVIYWISGDKKSWYTFWGFLVLSFSCNQVLLSHLLTSGLWWVNLGLQPDACPATPRFQQDGKACASGKVVYQFPSWVKQTKLVKINLCCCQLKWIWIEINKGKKNQMPLTLVFVIPFYTPFLYSSACLAFLAFLKYTSLEAPTLWLLASAFPCSGSAGARRVRPQAASASSQRRPPWSPLLAAPAHVYLPQPRDAWF